MAANASICSTPRCATARRPTASISRCRTSSRSRSMLDELGIDYVEGGYPGANPTDTELFAEDRAAADATFTAFGMTRRPGRSAVERSGPRGAARRQGRRDLLRRQVLGLSRARRARDHQRGEPRARSATACAPRRPKGREVLLDCEHFFDGYKANPRLCAGLRQGRLRGRRALGGAVRHQRRHAAARGRARSSARWSSTSPAIMSASTPTTTPSRRWPIRWPRCAPARARSRARSTASASAAATPTWSRSSRR